MAGWFSDFFDGFVGSAPKGAASGAVSGATGGGGGGSGNQSSGSFWGNVASTVAPYVIQGGLSYFGNQAKQKNDQKLQEQSQAYDQQKALQDHQFAKELLQMRLAESAGGGGGGGSDIARKQMLVNALMGQANTELAGGQLKMSSLGDMVAAIQRGLGMI